MLKYHNVFERNLYFCVFYGVVFAVVYVIMLAEMLQGFIGGRKEEKSPDTLYAVRAISYTFFFFLLLLDYTVALYVE